MAYKNLFLLKIAYIKNIYGKNAAEYFREHPFCETCPEKRLACLTVHHPFGKKVEEFQTLCFNCHMVHHATRSGSDTYETYRVLMENNKKEVQKTKERNKKIIKMISSGLSLRQVAKQSGISHVAVFYISQKSGVRSNHKNQFSKDKLIPIKNKDS